jgi:hypothetical protein
MGWEATVRTDDPELEKHRQEAFERVQKMDLLILSVLKTHLLTEQCMNDYMTASGLKKRWIKKRFADKMKKCKLLAKSEGNDPLWDVLEAANCLRNKIAHTPDITAINEKMAVLKEKYFSQLTENQVSGLKDRPDDYIAMSAFSTCAGFIATLESRVKSARAAATAAS